MLFQSARMGIMKNSTPWFVIQSQQQTYLNWIDNGPNFLHNQNARIGLDSSFHVFMVDNSAGK